YASPMHKALGESLGRSTNAPLLRGNWKQGTVLFVQQGSWRPEIPLVAADVLAEGHRLDVLTVFLTAPYLPRLAYDRPRVVVLEELESGADPLRPATLRLLAKSLT